MLGVGVDDPRGEVGVLMDEDRLRLGFRVGFSVGSRQEFGVCSLIKESSVRAETVKYYMYWLIGGNYSLQQAGVFC